MLEINDIIVFCGIIFTLLLLRSLKVLKPEDFSKALKISVIIPVRNEEHNISNLLSDIKKQTYDIFEVICVDDGSDDATAEIIRGYDVDIISAGSLPDGWKGKPWACQCGAQRAAGDVLLFIDADVRLHEKAIEVLASNYTPGDSCLSIHPYHKTKKLYEQLSFFFNLIQVMAAGTGLFCSVKRAAIFGPVFMVGRELFLKKGGYYPVKGDSAEDYSLGRLYKKQGTRINLLLGGGYISYRMYPLGICSLVEGWSKNFFMGAIKTRWWILFMLVAWVTAVTAIPQEITQGIINDDMLRVALYLAAYAFYAGCLAFTSKKVGSFKIVISLFYPLALLFFHLIFIYSFFTSFVFKCATWKGRKL